MKKAMFIFCVVSLLAFVSTSCKKKGQEHKDHSHKDHSHKDHDHDHKDKEKATGYVCPTPEHYQEKSEKKGTKCTKCEREMIQAGIYYCWMHGKKIITGKKGDTCEICKGMKLVRAGSGKKFAHDKAKDVKDGSKKEEKKEEK